MLVSWRMDTPDDALWVARFAAVVGRVVHVHDVEFDERPEVVPEYYRIPVEVWAGRERVVTCSLVRAATG